MTVREGYRVDLVGPDGFSEFVAALRRDATNVFLRHYGRILADETARRIDGHKSGHAPGTIGNAPLHDAVAHLRESYDASAPGTPIRAVNPRIRMIPVGASVLLVFEEGRRHYGRMLASLPGVAPADAPKERPADVEEAEWDVRCRLWDAAHAGTRLGRGLVFQLVEDALPVIRHGYLKRGFPSHESRCLRTAQAIVLERGTAGDAIALEVEREVRRLTRLLPREISEEDTRTYPVPRPRAARPAPVPRPVTDIPQLIDHADVVEAADGRVFVAIPDAGLDPDERVHIQVVDRYLSFVQGATHFGGVTNAPYAAVDLLRRSREVYVVELRRVDGRREIHARHVALVRDDSLPDVFKVAISSFRTSAARARRRANVQWME